MVGQAGYFVEGMADIQDGDVEFIAQALQIRQYLALALKIQRGERFVHEQKFRRGQQGAGDGDTLALAAGQSLWLALQQVADAQQLNDVALICWRGFVGFVASASDGAVVKIALHGQVREQACFLKDIAQGTAMHRQEEIARLPAFAIDDEMPVADFFQTGYAAQQCGFAGTRRAE